MAIDMNGGPNCVRNGPHGHITSLYRQCVWSGIESARENIHEYGPREPMDAMRHWGEKDDTN